MIEIINETIKAEDLDKFLEDEQLLHKYMRILEDAGYTENKGSIKILIAWEDN